MSKIIWDKTGERKFETGLSQGVLYPLSSGGSYTPGVAWNGLISMTEAPAGAEITDIYADDMKYAALRSPETFGGTIEAYTYPDEWEEIDGNVEVTPGMTVGQQSRKVFGVSYKTRVGSDVDPEASAYKLHLIYGATASPSEKQRQSVNDSPEAMTMSWEFNTTPVPVKGKKPTSHVTIDSAKVQPDKLKALEEILYGKESDEAEPRLPLPDEVATLLGLA